MRPSRFHHLLASYGADLTLWPENEREGARLLAEADPGCSAAMREAGRLDAMLAFDGQGPFDPGEEEILAASLRQRVMSSIGPRPRPRPFASLFEAWGPAILSPRGLGGVCAGTAALVLGAWLGWTQAGGTAGGPGDLLVALQTAPIVGGLL